jgi:hypothetical protein
MYKSKEINRKYYALYFYLLCMSIGLICNWLSDLGVINKESDANLMILVVIFILISSEILNNKIYKSVKREGQHK